MKIFIIISLLMLTACKGATGAMGPTGAIGAQGLAGENGQDGAQGPAGANGADGAQGPAGQDAPPTPYTPVGLINPCGDAAGIADEVFIEMANGQLVASYGTGNQVRFAVLTPGSYVTTDGDNCTFTINANGELENESH